MTHPRSAFGASPSRGRRQRPGRAGSAAAAWRQRLTPLALALLCAALPPAAWSQAAAPVGPTFQSLALDQAESLTMLLGRVLPRDPQVRVAQSLMEAAEQRRLQARSRLGPTFSINATRGKEQDYEFGVLIDRDTERVEGSMRWNLLNYGSDAAEFSGASRDLNAAAEELRRAREEVAERVAEAYAEVLRVEALLPRSTARLDSVRRLVQQVQRQADEGKVSPADAQQAEASLLDAEMVDAQLRSDLDAARRRLSALIGDEPRPVLPLNLPPAPDSLALATPRPGVVVAASERAQGARLRVVPTQSLLAPRIDLEYRKKISDRTTPQNTTELQYGTFLTARWDFPVGGENFARRSEAERRAEAVEAEAERVLQGVRSELVALGPIIDNAQRMVVQLDRQIEQYDRLVKAAELQFEAGRRSLPQLVALHDSRYNAEQRRSDQAHRLLTSQLRQLSLSGGLLPALGLPGD